MYVETANRPFLSILPLADPGKLAGATGHALTFKEYHSVGFLNADSGNYPHVARFMM